MLDQTDSKMICVIADGAAIGPEMDRLYKCALQKKNIYLYFPESFEWLILNSGLIQGKDIRAILDNPKDFLDSREYFSWERFFTKLLVERTKDSYIDSGEHNIQSVMHFSLIDNMQALFFQ